MIANTAAAEVKPGSMGGPTAGIEAGLLATDDHGEIVPDSDGHVIEITDHDQIGRLALRPGWPSMFRGYLNNEERYQQSFRDGWYLSGDLATRDADGYFWFVGRADDVIKSAGHLIGPFEVESALIEHAAVAEAGRVSACPTRSPARWSRPSCRSTRASSRPTTLRREHPGPRPQAARPRGRAHGDRLRRRRCPRPAAARSCAACCKARELGLPEGDTLDPGDAGRMAMTRRKRADHEPLGPGSTLGAARGMMLRSAASRRSAPSSTSSGKIRGFLHLYIGEEAVAAGVMHAARARGRRRRHLPRARPRAAAGVPTRAIMAEMYGKVEGCSRRARRLDAPLRRASTLLRRQRHRRRRAAAGRRAGARRQDARAATGSPSASSAKARWPRASSTRAMNLAALWQLPVLFCCENNRYAMGTALARSESETDLALQGRGLRDAGGPVDGMDVVAVVDGTRRGARDASASGSGPAFLELQTYRFRAHSMFDAELYRDKSEVDEWTERDPITILFDRLVAAEAGRRRRTRRASRPRSTPRSTRRSSSPTPSPLEDVATLERHVYAPATRPRAQRRSHHERQVGDDLPRGHARSDPRGDAAPTSACS